MSHCCRAAWRNFSFGSNVFFHWAFHHSRISRGKGSTFLEHKNFKFYTFFVGNTYVIISFNTDSIGIGFNTLKLSRKQDLSPCTLKWMQPVVVWGLGISVLVSSRAQRAVRARALMPARQTGLRWAELQQGDRHRDRQIDRPTDRQKSGHLDRQAAGSHGGVTGRMVLSCSVAFSLKVLWDCTETTGDRTWLSPEENYSVRTVFVWFQLVWANWLFLL